MSSYLSSMSPGLDQQQQIMWSANGQNDEFLNARTGKLPEFHRFTSSGFVNQAKNSHYTSFCPQVRRRTVRLKFQSALLRHKSCELQINLFRKKIFAIKAKFYFISTTRTTGALTWQHRHHQTDMNRSRSHHFLSPSSLSPRAVVHLSSICQHHNRFQPVSSLNISLDLNEAEKATKSDNNKFVDGLS